MRPTAYWVMRRTYDKLDHDTPVRDFHVTRPDGEVVTVTAADTAEVLRAEPDAVDIIDRHPAGPARFGRKTWR